MCRELPVPSYWSWLSLLSLVAEGATLVPTPTAGERPMGWRW